MRKHDAEVSLPRAQIVKMYDREVTHVLRYDSAPLEHRRSQELSVREPSQIRTLGDRDDVVSALAEFDRYGVGEVLIEQNSQRRAACSRRQAASCSSAASSFALISASISSRFAA